MEGQKRKSPSEGWAWGSINCLAYTLVKCKYAQHENIHTGDTMNTVPKLKKLPASGSRRHEQAHFIWIILSGWVLFNKGKTLSYGELAEFLGYSPQAGRTLADPLGIVSIYCLENNLPPLSCIVVAKGSNTPGWEGMIPTDSTLELEQNKVWNTRWHLFRVPSVGTFRKAQEQLDWSSYI
jgi:hypothetical protein